MDTIKYQGKNAIEMPEFFLNKVISVTRSEENCTCFLLKAEV